MHIPNSAQNTYGMIFFNLLAVSKSPNYYLKFKIKNYIFT